MRLRFIAIVIGAVLPMACQSNPFCLNCQVADAGHSAQDLRGVDLANRDFTTPADLTGAACMPTHGAIEICDGLDNDCNGIIDDVAAARLAADPNNCGVCGHACDFTAQRQFGACDPTGGTPTCRPSGCVPGYVDADSNAANGCEYACTPTNNGIEICDGKDNNCNGAVDEGFALASDGANCGACGVSCLRPNTPGSCLLGACKLGACASGYKDLDGNPNNGCEYQCPVFPIRSETCNGLDDDCDGIKDNAVTDVGQRCDNYCGQVAACVAGNTCSWPLSACVGACCGMCTSGAVVCSGGAKVCQAGARPQLETCDGKDNNCDGQIDEGFDTANDPLNCGMCGRVCNLPNVLSVRCGTGNCGILHTGTLGTPAYQQSGCQPGFSDLNNIASDGCEHTCEMYPTSVEVCDGKDNNCDARIDEVSALTAPANFCRTTSLCTGAVPVCCGTVGWLCDYKSVNAGIEIQESAPYSCKRVSDNATRLAGTLVFSETKCDELDGDCRNGVDDAFLQKGKACSVGVGICAGTSSYVCNNAGTGLRCPAGAVPANAKAEECNGKDDNCDGQVDERIPTVAMPAYLPGYVDGFVQIASSLWVYAYEASRVDALPSTSGVASARACSKLGVLPWANVTHSQAAAACAAIVLSDGVSRARLCSQSEWQNACEGPNGPYNNAYSYSTANTAYAVGVCNDINRQMVGAAWTAGFDNAQGTRCYTDWAAAGRLFDLSGNLMEWTSDKVTLSGTDYYRVRGGNYDSPSDGIAPDGTSCEFDFNILPDAFENKNVGFRCCADVAP